MYIALIMTLSLYISLFAHSSLDSPDTYLVYEETLRMVHWYIIHLLLLHQRTCLHIPLSYEVSIV
jgi:hypothetical protein